MQKMIYARIAGTGSYLPEKILTNFDLEKMVDTTDEWIVSRTGIRERRIASPDLRTSDMGALAARKAMDMAETEPAEIDLVLVATTTPDQVFPSVACLLQDHLDIHNGGIAFDIQAVCAGFVYAIDIANRFLKTGGARKALVVGAETFSRIIDWSDRDTCILFGDGAGAFLLEADTEPGVVSTHLHADGKYHELLNVPAGISADYETILKGEAYTRMQGSEVFRWAVKALSDVAQETLDLNGLSAQDIDWFVPHQANIRIIKAVAKKLNLPMERVVVTLDRHGNTSAASIPLAFDEAVRDGRIKRGQKILLEGFGGGFTWGSSLIKF
jgi:3-oxoacyl-[acyl-carrier-protein] synthase-3